MTSVKNIRIPKNYVLIKVDEDYSTLQRAGKDSGIIAASYIYEQGAQIKQESPHFAVTGKVFGVPEKIGFFRDEIELINKSQTLVGTTETGQQAVVDGVMLRKINDLKNQSCRFETDNELEIGDIIKFSYFVHITAKEKGAIFDTEEGKMYFIKYDDVYMTLNDDLTPKKMVNGYILVDPEVIETKKEGGLEYAELSHGLVQPKMSEVSKHKRGKKCMEGIVKLAAQPLTVTTETGKRPGGYFEIAGYFEKPIEVNSGDRILFDPRVALQVEHDAHQAMFDHRLYIMQRKDIIFMEKDNEEVFSEIGLDKLAI